MRNALIISMGLHLAVAFVCFRLVKVSQVRFVPLEVYTVSLVTPAQAKKPAAVAAPPAPAPETAAAEKPEEKAEEKPEEMSPPPEKPKPKAKPKSHEKIVPSTNITKTGAPDATPPEAGAGDQVMMGDISLDGQDFPFSYYVTTMRRKIAAFWEVPGTSTSQQTYCQVHFRVLRNGSIQSPSIETSSGSFLFDQAAVRAVVQASPLPPLPDGFADEYLGVHFSFTYEPGYSYEPK